MRHARKFAATIIATGRRIGDFSVQFRPDRVGTLLMDDPDSDEYHAVCDPEKPFSWRNPLIFRHLVSLAKEGRVVVAKAGLRSWRIFADGRSQELA